MDICTKFGFDDVRWKKVFSSEKGYIEILAFNGNPQLHMTVVMGVDASFLEDYNGRMRAYASKRIAADQRFLMIIDMRHAPIDLDALCDFIRKVGRLHEDMYEQDKRYTTLLQRVIILVPNKLIAHGLNVMISSTFRPLVPIIIRSADDDLSDVVG